MSQHETITGTLKEYPPIEGETVRETITRFIKSKGHSISTIYDDASNYTDEELLLDHMYRRAVLVDGKKILEVVNSKDVEEGDFFQSKSNPDGTINFSVSYWNGGMGFTEAIHEALENKQD